MKVNKILYFIDRFNISADQKSFDCCNWLNCVFMAAAPIYNYDLNELVGGCFCTSTIRFGCTTNICYNCLLTKHLRF